MSFPFVHLHVHSEYSIVDGIIRIDDLMDTVAKHKSPAVALTDQGNLFAMVKFYQAAEKAGVKPILGADVWILNEENPKNSHRMILLCQNEQGFRHLTELVSQSYIEDQILGRPHIKKENLRSKNQGLIAISPVRESDIVEALYSEHQELAEACVEYWTGIFGDRFYLEVARTRHSGEDIILKALIKLAHAKECPIVATNDVRFLEKEDFEAHEARVCIHEGFTLNDGARIKKYTEEQYLKSSEDMQDLFSDLPEALENAFEIAKRCNLELKLGQVYLPNFPVEAGKTIESFFREEAERGLLQRFNVEKLADISPVYLERFNTEINVLNAMGYAGYFLIVADFIRWAIQNGVPVGPGRGSGAGSLVAYALHITGLDPLLYDLLFERFLNPERVSMPDFDIDFCMEGRDRVIEYVANTYGRDSVSQIITFGTMAAKAVIRDVGRVLGHPYGFVDKIAKLIPLELGITLEKALKSEENLKKMYDEEEEVRILIDLAQKLEGITRNAGKHAGGVVIAPRKLTDFTPLYCDETEGVLLSQLDKNDVETIGLVKFDFLGLRTLTIIDWAQKTVNEQNQKLGLPPVDVNKLAMDDEKTFDLLRSCHTTAVFQLESRGMKDLVRRLEPDNFEEIIALVALFRPGPLQSGMVDDFINRKHGRAVPEYLHPKLTNILKPTYGIILYQEQVMQIAQELAGYTLGAADLLRRAMGKKKPEEMAKQRDIFTKGAVARGVEEERANYIFDLMEKFAGYGFNKSHSAAYAMLTYQTAWLKAHYPAAFMAAVLSSDMAHTDKVVIFVDECRQLKIPLLPPNINQSMYKFTVDDEGQILYGLGAIKGVGETAIQHMIETREKAPFQDIFDFCARLDGKRVNRRTLEALIRSGAMDSLGEHRAALMASLEDALLAATQLTQNRSKGQADLFGDSLNSTDVNIHAKNTFIPPWPKPVIYEGEKETLGFYLSGHPLEEYKEELSKIITSTIRDLRMDSSRRVTIAGLIVNSRSLFTKKGDKMAFITVDDQTERQEVAVFSDLYRVKQDLLIKDNLVVVEGELSHDEYTGGYKMRCQNIMSIEELRTLRAKCLKLTIDQEYLTDKILHELKTLFKQSKGNLVIKMLYQKNGILSVLKLDNSFSINPKQSLIEKLKEVLGANGVEICYSE